MIPTQGLYVVPPYPKITQNTEIEINGNESVYAEFEADYLYSGKPDFSLILGSVKYLVHSEALGYDLDMTHELWANADKRNLILGRLLDMCYEEWYLKKKD